MIRKNRFLVLICIFFSVCSMCYAKEKNIKLTYSNFYYAIRRSDIECVKEHLEAGFNPNKCTGTSNWVDSIPLKVLAEGLDGTYCLRIEYSDYVYNDSDIKILELLIKYGANINQLPYIWDRVYRYENWDLDHLNGKEKLSSEQYELEQTYFIEDVNRLLEAMLKAGADPNMKGHPFPFGHSRRLLFFSDKKAFKYFNSSEATTPLYEAIKKGSLWESQVDLLLKYGATLDESCLEAAKLSSDEKMIEKIKKLYESKS